MTPDSFSDGGRYLAPDAARARIDRLLDEGADVIEVGMPFTDPMADGPAIQAAGVRALAAGQNMKKTLQLVRDFRGGDKGTPIVLMGYYSSSSVFRSGVPGA